MWVCSRLPKNKHLMPHCPPDDPDEAMGLSTPSTEACGPWRTNQRASTSSHILNRRLPETSSLGLAPPSSQEEIHVCRERTKDTPTKYTTWDRGGQRSAWDLLESILPHGGASASPSSNPSTQLVRRGPGQEAHRANRVQWKIKGKAKNSSRLKY